MADRQGIPLAALLTAANVNEGTVLARVLDAIAPIRRPRGRPGRPRQRPAKVHADKAYDSRRCRADARQRGILPASCHGLPAEGWTRAKSWAATAG